MGAERGFRTAEERRPGRRPGRAGLHEPGGAGSRRAGAGPGTDATVRKQGGPGGRRRGRGGAPCGAFRSRRDGDGRGPGSGGLVGPRGSRPGAAARAGRAGCNEPRDGGTAPSSTRALAARRHWSGGRVALAVRPRRIQSRDPAAERRPAGRPDAERHRDRGQRRHDLRDPRRLQGQQGHGGRRAGASQARDHLGASTSTAASICAASRAPPGATW